MKIKYLVILFVFFLVVIFLSLSINQQTQKVAPLSGQEIPVIEPKDDRVVVDYTSKARSAPIVASPLVKSGITIVKAPVAQREEANIAVTSIADKTTNNISSQNAVSSTQAQGSSPAGITRIGKRPDPKAAQEMNSSGIVMY